MNQIKSFKELGIKNTEPKNFIGDKIPVKKIIGKEITIHDFKICASNFKGKRLDLQITFNENKRVIFTSSVYLSETIEKISKDSFPFTTTIIEDNDRFTFT